MTNQGNPSYKYKISRLFSLKTWNWFGSIHIDAWRIIFKFFYRLWIEFFFGVEVFVVLSVISRLKILIVRVWYTRDAYGYLLRLPVRACSPQQCARLRCVKHWWCIKFARCRGVKYFIKHYMRKLNVENGFTRVKGLENLAIVLYFPGTFTVYAKWCATTEFPFYWPHGISIFQRYVSLSNYAIDSYTHVLKIHRFSSTIVKNDFAELLIPRDLPFEMPVQ